MTYKINKGGRSWGIRFLICNFMIPGRIEIARKKENSKNDEVSR